MIKEGIIFIGKYINNMVCGILEKGYKNKLESITEAKKKKKTTIVLDFAIRNW